MEVIFNESSYQENVLNRWKFLEKMDAEAGKVGYLIQSPVPLLTMTISYILFVCIIGPLYMRNREPYQLKTVIRFYNLIMVFLAGYLLYRLYDAVETLEYMFDCSKVFNFSDLSANKTYRMANLILFVRLSEYLDTIFFTLRKKQNQVTFLHVFHHAFVPIYAYWILRTAPMRLNVFIIIVNSFIHVLMYFYYYLATFQQSRDPKGLKKTEKQGAFMYIVAKLLLFKKYMTQLQILQFVSLAMYSLWALTRRNSCQIPLTYIFANLLLALCFLGLFTHFYVTVYRKGSTTGKAKKE